jgi:hypothetical protein
VLSKADLLPPGAQPPRPAAPDAFETYLVSGVARSGLQELAEGLWAAVRRAIEAEAELEERDRSAPRSGSP